MRQLKKQEAKQAKRALDAMKPFLPIYDPKFTIYKLDVGYGVLLEDFTQVDRDKMSQALEGTRLTLEIDGGLPFVVYRS